MASYPTSDPSFATRNTGDVVQAAHVNDVGAEVVAIGAALRATLQHAVIVGTGGLTVSSGGFTVSTGNTVLGQNLSVVGDSTFASNVTLSSGHLTLSSGNVRLSTGTVQIGSSNTRVLGMVGGVTPGFGREVVTLANDGVVNIGNARGLLVVAAAGGGNPEVGVFAVISSGGATEISDAAGVFSVAHGTASNLNVSWDSTVVTMRIENKRGAGRDVSWALMGVSG